MAGKKKAASKKVAKKVTKKVAAKKFAKKAAKKKVAKKKAPTHEEIKILAQAIYEDRCAHGKPGDQDSDWAEAERQLMR